MFDTIQFDIFYLSISYLKTWRYRNYSQWKHRVRVSKNKEPRGHNKTEKIT